MCFLVFAFKAHPAYKLILAANRDEYYDRPSEPASWWQTTSQVLSGKDLKAGGTWLGITKNGRIGAVTNFRDPKRVKPSAPSRGLLVTEFLLGDLDPGGFLDKLKVRADQYNGFNLVVGVPDELFWYSNLRSDFRRLEPGVYGLSNHFLDTPWPKVLRGKKLLSRIMRNGSEISPERLFGMLADQRTPEDTELPNTGVGLEWERTLSPIFITSPDYGTRCSTIILIDNKNRTTLMEKTFDRNTDRAECRKYEFQIGGNDLNLEK
ncbi:MAG: NRDE family protein [Deltaproteobacteria bacterium]|nr:NRDE family protein [Deltaproteobacteria bacterium]MBW2136992.1 NRDE family protein [Deltaproteobacteria bacterium]